MTLDALQDLFRADEGLPVETHVSVGHAFSGNRLRKLQCRTVNDQFFFEGDIIVRPVSVPQRIKHAGRFFGAGVADHQTLWPRGVVPYARNHALQGVVDAAIAHWMTRTPIQFRHFGGERDYLTFEVGEQSGSEVGRRGGEQIVFLKPSASVGTAIHEIGHSLGLWHEHSRTDRYTYIDIHWENIDLNDRRQFEQSIYNAIDLEQYDFASIMHYPSDAFSTNGRPTITAKNGVLIGQRNGLSDGDVSAIKKLYPDLEWV